MGWKECKERFAKEIPEPRRYTSKVDREALILAELREIKELLKLIKDRI